MISKSIIVSINRKNAIGKENDLLFKDREDLSRFKGLTKGHPVIMGRKTHESIGRALPKRTNIIVTRNKDYIPLGLPALVTTSLESAIAIAEKQAQADGIQQVFIIGGGEIYEQAMPLCDTLYVSEFNNDLDGDTFFPDYDKTQWEELIVEDCKTHTFKFLKRIAEEETNQKKT